MLTLNVEGKIVTWPEGFARYMMSYYEKVGKECKIVVEGGE